MSFDINAASKEEIIKEFAINENDTGSPEVQIALLTSDILRLTNHFSYHKKDHCSRRGLYIMVSKRRKFLDHLKSRDHDRYANTVARLGLRK